MKIRRGKKEDIIKIWPIQIETRKYHKKITDKKYSILNKQKIDNKSRLKFIRSFDKYMGKKKFIFLIAEEKNEIMGYVHAFDGKWGWSDESLKTIKIDDIVILKKYRKKGIATRLMKELEKIAKKRKADFFTLGVWLKNKPAHNLYKKNKFDDFSIEMVKKLR